MAWYIPQDLSSYMNPGVLWEFLVGVASDQKMLFSTPLFRPDPGCSKAGERYPPDKSLFSG